jgi:Fe-S-cluster containining protein
VPVVMTHAEADLVRAATDRPLAWVPHPSGKVGLVNPDGTDCCPCLGADGRCTIYAVRPYPCRAFACLRDPGEPLEPGGPLGCANAARRLTDRASRRFLTLYQRRAQVWGRAHGWTDDAQ